MPKYRTEDIRNIALVGDLIVEGARQRRESRGLHYTVDYPDADDDLAQPILFDKTRGPSS